MSFSVRPLHSESDKSALVGLHNAIELDEGREGTMTVEQLQNSLALPNIFRWVVEAPDDSGKLAGYGAIFQQTPDRCYGDARVHPAWRRLGIGRMLLGAMVDKAANLGTKHLAVDVAADNREALRFLLSRGFRYRGDSWVATAGEDIAFAPPLWPAGYRLSSYADEGDLPLMVALSNQTFGDLWGHWENTPGMVDEARMAEVLRQFDPRGVFLVFDSRGNAVAQCRAQAAPDSASPHVIDQPGVVPGERASGLHVPLLLSAGRWLREQSIRPVRLESWGDPVEIIATYESIGFRRTTHRVSYVRELNG